MNEHRPNRHPYKLASFNNMYMAELCFGCDTSASTAGILKNLGVVLRREVYTSC